MIHELVAGGTTVLLTTQYLEEADELADDIVVLDHGRAIAHGSPTELKAMIGGERLEVVVVAPADVEPAAAACGHSPTARPTSTPRRAASSCRCAGRRGSSTSFARSTLPASTRSTCSAASRRSTTSSSR